MKHELVYDKLIELAEGEFSGKMEREMLDHVEKCDLCREEYETHKKLNSLYGAMPEKELPDGFYDRLYAKIPEIDPMKAPKKKESWLDALLSVFSKPSYAFGGVLVIAMLIGIFFFIKHDDPLTPDAPPTVVQRADLTFAYGDEAVEYQNEKGKWVKSEKTFALKKGDALRTGDSKAVVMFDTENNLRLAPKTQVKVVAVAFKNNKPTGRIKLEKGRVWVDEKSTRLAVETDHLIVEPIGTSYEVYREKTGSTVVSCYEGQINVTLRKSNRKFELYAGEKFSSTATEVAELVDPDKAAQKPESEAKIEKITSEKLENDDWYEWNRQVELPKLPESGYPVNKTQIRRVERPAPRWLKKDSARSTAPLAVPRTRDGWNKFNQRRKLWREKGYVPGNGSRNQPQSQSQGAGKLSPAERAKQQAAERFAKRAPRERIMIIRKLKSLGKLPANYPESTTILTDEALKELARVSRQKQMNNRNGNPVQPSNRPSNQNEKPPVPRMPGQEQKGNQQPDSSNNKPGFEIDNGGPQSQQNSELQITPQMIEKSKERFAGLNSRLRKVIIRSLKRKGVLAQDYPENATVLPDYAHASIIRSRRQNQNQGGRPMQQPQQGNKPSTSEDPYFKRLPAERRRVIINGLKRDGVLPLDYPTDSTSLPPDAQEYMKSQQMPQGGPGGPGGRPPRGSRRPENRRSGRSDDSDTGSVPSQLQNPE